MSQVSRRDLIRGSVAFAALAFARHPLAAFGLDPLPAGDELIPFLDVQPVGKGLRWEKMNSWITPNDQVFAVSHYGTPEVDLPRWKLDVSGLVKKPASLTLPEIRSRRRKTVTATLECSGNSMSTGFMGAVGNVKWTGTPLAPLLRECGLHHRAIEAVFFGADEKVEKIRDKDYTQNFARSLSLKDALRDDVILAYEMNGQPLDKSHGSPLRLIVPGWFGIAWIKWLTRIELLDRRYMSKYMAREYVTIRGEERSGKTIWRETSVGPMDVKSIIAHAVRRPGGTVRFTGAAWTDGTPLERVEIRIDDGEWRPAPVNTEDHSKYSWSFFHYDWKQPSFGEHTVVSRAIDADGRVQPSADDPLIKLKQTYWEANQQWPRKIRL
ncbi:MAG: sulfite oxidase [Pedosphaera sp.]|nr:sulfite oxidase [Pedosphaera sp.]